MLKSLNRKNQSNSKKIRFNNYPEKKIYYILNKQYLPRNLRNRYSNLLLNNSSNKKHHYHKNSSKKKLKAHLLRQNTDHSSNELSYLTRSKSEVMLTTNNNFIINIWSMIFNPTHAFVTLTTSLQLNLKRES